MRCKINIKLLTTLLTIIILGALLFSISIQKYVYAAQTQKLEPKRGGTLVVGTGFDPYTWVQIFEPAGVWWSGFNIYDQLVQVDINTNIKPELAKSWYVSSDGLTYTFHLFENVTWHDGVKFTSADVKFTFEKLLEEGPAANGYTYVKGIDHIETPDEHTVIIKMKHVDAGFLYGLGTWMGVTHIIAKHIYEGTDWRTNDATLNHPIGTGPFKFLEHVTGDHYTLVANENYHLGRPYLDRVIYKIIPDVAVQQAALTAGEIGYMVDNPPFSELPGLMRNPELRVVLRPYVTDMALLIFNLEREPLSNPRVRHALAYAINRTEINQVAYLGLCTPGKGAYSATYPGLEWAFNPNALLPDYDPVKAEQLLDEAGYPRGTDGIRFTLNIKPAMLWREFEFVSLNIKEQLKKVGINVNIELLDYSSWWDKVHMQRDFDACLYQFYAGPDPYMMGVYLETGEIDNIMHYSNPRVDELIHLARSTLDQEKRKEYYWEIQEHVINDMPFIYLIEYKWPQVVRQEYHGFTFDDPELENNPRIPGPIWDLFGVWWEGGTPIATPTPTPIATPTPTPTPTMFLESLIIVVVIIIVVAIIAIALLRRKR
jgi:peptide/nickel transport system substrate-binding protein